MWDPTPSKPSSGLVSVIESTSSRCVTMRYNQNFVMITSSLMNYSFVFLDNLRFSGSEKMDVVFERPLPSRKSHLLGGSFWAWHDLSYLDWRLEQLAYLPIIPWNVCGSLRKKTSAYGRATVDIRWNNAYTSNRVLARLRVSFNIRIISMRTNLKKKWNGHIIYALF